MGEMSKPNDIPQDIWEAADRALVGWHGTSVHVACARAIMAAKNYAYTEIAEMADAFADAADFSAMNNERPDIIARYRTEEDTLNRFAASIRKRGALS